MPGIRCDRLSEVARSVFETVELRELMSQVVQRVHVAWIEGDSLLVAVDGVIRLAPVSIDVPELVVRLRRLRIELHRFSEGGDSLLMLPAGGEDGAEVGVMR